TTPYANRAPAAKRRLGINRAAAIRPRRDFAFSRRRSALIAMSPSEAEFRAEPVERLSAPEEPSPAERRGLALALVAAAALHLIIPLALIVYYAIWPP